MFEFICGVTIGSIIGIKIYNKYDSVQNYYKLLNKKINLFQKYKAHIVKFNDKYAIRRYRAGDYEYKSLSEDFWWSINQIAYCLGSLEQCEKELEQCNKKNEHLKKYGTPINN